MDAQTDLARTCAGCRHRLRHGTCGEPVRAGLMPSFGIVWPPDGHAADCAAFEPRPPRPTAAVVLADTPE